MSSLYDDLVRMIPDRRFVFMNHGYAGHQAEDFSWLDPADRVFRYSANLVRRLIEELDLAGRSVLDVGCGRGGACSYLARYARAGTVLGLDACRGNVVFCRDVHRHPGVAFVHADAQDLPFADARFDFVTNMESSHSYPHLPKFFAETMRVLRPGGTFCYTDNLFVRPGNVTAADRVTQLQVAGFQVLESTEITDDVARGVLASSQDLTTFFIETIDAERTNAHRVARLLSGITIQAYALYTARRLSYWIWRLRKPA